MTKRKAKKGKGKTSPKFDQEEPDEKPDEKPDGFSS